MALDVTSDSSVDDLVSQLEAPVDVLVNNAGLQHVAALEDFPPEKWQQLIDVMLVGVAKLTRALLPGMREQGHGRIINIGSIHSLVASRYKSAYVAAKHGLLGFSKVLALETPSNPRSEEHTSELQSRGHLVCRLLLEKKKFIFQLNSPICTTG